MAIKQLSTPLFNQQSISNEERRNVNKTKIVKYCETAQLEHFR